MDLAAAVAHIGAVIVVPVVAKPRTVAVVEVAAAAVVVSVVGVAAADILVAAAVARLHAPSGTFVHPVESLDAYGDLLPFWPLLRRFAALPLLNRCPRSLRNYVIVHKGEYEIFFLLIVVTDRDTECNGCPERTPKRYRRKSSPPPARKYGTDTVRLWEEVSRELPDQIEGFGRNRGV